MFRTLKANKDSYVTNKFISGKQAVSGNVGLAGTLDLFKLYGITAVNSLPQTELSRILIHFDLDPLKDLVASGKVDITDPSFKCLLNLKDVYGGQTTPNNFTVNVFPLANSFAEGGGKDVAYYADFDRCNFLSASNDQPWILPGCSAACFSTGVGDYITSSVTLPSTIASQNFVDGTEDLLVDVTSVISATLSNDLPDEGFRISFDPTAENDTHSYFVKRFASRHAYDETKHPKLIVKFDDSVQDESSSLYFDTTGSKIFLRNYVHNQATNLISASLPVAGDNCVLLKLQTQVSGVGTYELSFLGSQYKNGSIPVAGNYYAEVSFPLSDTNLNLVYTQSGSVKFTPIWGSIDGTVAYITGSSLTVKPPQRTSQIIQPQRYTVNAIGIFSDYSEDQDVTFRVNVQDRNDPLIMLKRLPYLTPNVVFRNAYYAIRNVATNEYAIPFDIADNSTKLSCDSSGMYFTFNTSALTPLNSYVVDVMILVDNLQQKYLNASSVFRIIKV